MKKPLIIIITVLLITLLGALYFYNDKKQSQIQEEAVMEQTLTIAREYVYLRLQTDDVLTNAKNYPDYESWDAEMTKIIEDWGNLAQKSQELENSANKTAEKVSAEYKLINTAHAYTAKEISDIYDKAPRFKGIATLANHLGVDAKRAQSILDQAQAEITAGVFTEEGDAFKKLENTAIVVKDGCKVAGFVGGVVLTGGTAGLAAAGTLTKVTVVVAGADLALEVTEDGAQIALGDKNKVTSLVRDVRTVTEPVASVLSITNIPGNLGTAYGKIDAVMIGLEQFRESAQEGKVVGVDLTTFESHRSFQVIRKTQYPGTISAAEMEMAEVESWLNSLNKKQEQMTPAEAMAYLKPATAQTEPAEQIVEENTENITEETKSEPVEQVENTQSSDPKDEQDTASNSITTQSMAGTYSGSAILQHVEEDVETPDSLPVTLQINEDGTGTVNVNGYTGEASMAGNNVTFSVTMKDSGAAIYCTFRGRAASNGDSVTISGTMNFTMMGVTFASYSWSAQK